MNNNTNRLLIDYLHGTLSGVERTRLETQLRDDAQLRERLAALRAIQRQLVGAVSAEIQSQNLPASMNFAAISADVKRRPQPPLHRRFVTTMVGFAALALLLFAVIYSLPDQTIEHESGPNTPAALIDVTSSPLPTTTPPLTVTNSAVSLPTRTPTVAATPGGSTIVTATPEAYNPTSEQLQLANIIRGSSTIPIRTPPTLIQDKVENR